MEQPPTMRLVARESIRRASNSSKESTEMAQPLIAHDPSLNSSMNSEVAARMPLFASQKTYTSGSMRSLLSSSSGNNSFHSKEQARLLGVIAPAGTADRTRQKLAVQVIERAYLHASAELSPSQLPAADWGDLSFVHTGESRHFGAARIAK